MRENPYIHSYLQEKFVLIYFTLNGDEEESSVG